MSTVLIERRMRRLFIISSFFLAMLMLNLYRMQILQGRTYRVLSEKNRIRTIYLEAPRGRIFDRNGQLVATNRLSFNCSVIPSQAKSKIAESIPMISEILQEDPAVLLKSYQQKKPGVFSTVILSEDIGLEKAVAIEERLDLLPGFSIETKPQRLYPLSESTAHLLGYIGPQTTEEKIETRVFDYRLSDWIGRDGVERTYESYLRGRSGGVQMEVNNRGRFVRALGIREPREGKDIQLTIDARLQQMVQEQIKNEKGAVLAMDLRDGSLLCVNSAPSFNPNLFSSKKGRQGVGKYMHDVKSPMINRGVQGCYPPGSIFKVVTALAALETGKTRTTTRFNCTGSLTVGGNRFRCWKEEGHGSQGLVEGFTHSCNVFFWLTGMNAGVDAIEQTALKFGYYRRTGIDLPGERTGFVPSRLWKQKILRLTWYEGETANLSIGQGYLQVSPIQALEMISVVATNGRLLKPHIIDKIDGVRVSENSMTLIPIKSEYLNAIKEGLDQVINSDSGTGRLARVAGLRIAGKTGTAQSGQFKTHAWFVGYAPAGKPKIAIVVFLEHGGRGGVSAASLAHEVFSWLKTASYL